MSWDACLDYFALETHPGCGQTDGPNYCDGRSAPEIHIIHTRSVDLSIHTTSWIFPPKNMVTFSTYY